ncbi:MAG TPA: hypothetical protein VF120_10490 [Ktedonobacterales bacterium]
MDPRDHTWPSRVLAAPANGGASGGANGGTGGDQRDQHLEAPSSMARPPRRRKLVSQARRGNAGNWRIRGVVLRQRLAQWFVWTRKERLHMSLRELQAAAHADGVSLSVTSIKRIESLIDAEVAEERSWIAVDYVLWLAAYTGQSLADVDRFITSGDWRYVGQLADTATSEESQADRVRVNFLALSPTRKQAALDFITFARALDEADQAAELGLRVGVERLSASQSTAARRVPTADGAATAEATLDPHTEGVLADLARGEEVMRAELRRHEQLTPGEAGEESQQGQPGGASHPSARRQKRQADQS